MKSPVLVRKQLPMVAIVGRPNVGKSTFFNRMTGSRRALAFNRAGVTRDRHYAEVDYLGRDFILVDTGGFEPDAAQDNVFRQVQTQALLAVEEADVVLVFFDVRHGVVPGDQELVDLLRSYERPTLYVVNKADNDLLESEAYDFYRLGIETLFPMSCEQSRGGDALLDALIELLPPPIPAEDAEAAAAALALIDEGTEEDEEEAEGGGDSESEDAVSSGVEGSSEYEDDWEGDEADFQETSEEDLEGLDSEAAHTPAPAFQNYPVPQTPRIALVGRPNVGKSSVANRILGSERQVIHSEAGTTRDSIEIPFEANGRPYILIDTAGVRRKARITDRLEAYTVLKAFRAVEGCDIAMLMLDATEGVTGQEKRLAGLIEEKGRGVVVLVNKWDLIKGRDRQSYAEELLSHLEHIRYAPVHFLSAKTGMGVQGILPVADKVNQELCRSIGTRDLNQLLKECTEAHHPPLYRGQVVRLYYGVQVRNRPPTFLFFSNQPEGIRPEYRRYLENRIRSAFGFEGAPVHIVIRARRR